MTSFTDNLRLTGKRIVELQVTLALVHSPSTRPQITVDDKYGREPFRHTALEGLDGLTAGESAKEPFMDKKRTAQLAEDYGLAGVVRWKPKNVRYMLPNLLCLIFRQLTSI